MDYLTKRFDMIAERILENERLTADLDDEAAQVLLDWGLSSAKLIVDSTAGIEDEEEADEAMYTRLRANARLMRTVNKWVPARQTMDELASLQEFGKVGQYVATVYAETFMAPSKPEWQAFLSSYQANSDVDMIVNLRHLFERSGRSVPVDEPTQTEASRSDDFSRSSPPNPPETTEAVTTDEPTQSQASPSSPPNPPETSEVVTTDEPTQSEASSSDDFSRSSPPNPPETSEVVTTDEPTQSQASPSSPPNPPETSEVVTTDEPTQSQASPSSPPNPPETSEAVTTNQEPSPREQASSKSPKSLVRRLWNWTTSFFRKR